MKRSPLFALLFVYFIDNFGYALIFPIFGPLLLNPDYGFATGEMTLGMRNLMLGILLAMYPMALFFGAPLIGDISDRMGRKKAFYLTITGLLFAHLLTGWALMLHSLPFLFVSRLLGGFFGGNTSICLSAIADLSPDDKTRSKNFGYVVAIQGVSFFLSVLIGGVFSNKAIYKGFSPALPFWLTAALSLLSLLAIMFLYQETHPGMEKLRLNVFEGFRNIREALRIKPLRFLYLITYFWFFGWVLTFQWFPAYSIQKFYATEMDLTWSLVGVSVVWGLGGAVLNRWLIKFFDFKSILKAGTFLVVLGLLSIALSTSYFCYVGSFWFACLAGSLVWGNLMDLVSVSAPESIQGKAMGMSQSTVAVTQVLAPFLGGIIAASDIGILFYVATASSFIGFLLLLSRRN